MDSDGPTTIVLTVATADWREAIDHLEERSERIVAATLQHSTTASWLRRSEVSILLTHDDEIRELNRHYRGRDQSTNVLSFPNVDLDKGQALASPSPGPLPSHQVLLGDIAMSFQRLSEEADLYKKPLLDHFAHLLVHGMLHLLGYDHQNDQQAEVMERIEESILSSLGMAAPYAVRDSVDRLEALP
ncbi:MAG: rRNA maturation RNase YbeY [Geminicoccaceae bacterium]